MLTVCIGLAKALCTSGKGVSVNSTLCHQCQKLVVANNFVKEETNALVFGCGHIYHSNCLQLAADASAICPHCRTKSLPMTTLSKTTPNKNKIESYDNTRLRPDVEGHF